MASWCSTAIAISAVGLLLAGCAGKPELPSYGVVPDFTLTDQTGQTEFRQAGPQGFVISATRLGQRAQSLHRQPAFEEIPQRIVELALFEAQPEFHHDGNRTGRVCRSGQRELNPNMNLRVRRIVDMANQIFRNNRDSSNRFFH